MRKSIFFFICILQACTIQRDIISNVYTKYADVKKDTLILKTWQYKDIVKDSIPGISLDRAYQELIPTLPKGKEVVVAVIDTQMDLNHEDLKPAFWTNSDEIPNNGMDDDKNGYIDDVHGWNFIGNVKRESVFESNFEYTRIIKKDNKRLKNYLKANKKYEKQKKYYNEKLKGLVFMKHNLDTAKIELKKYFSDNDFNIENLKLIKTKNKRTKKQIGLLIFCLENDLMDESLNTWINKFQRFLDYYLNTNYNDRKLIGDNEEDITDVNYGSPYVNIMQSQLIYHATYIAGTLNANRYNNIGAVGVYDKIKIMPISISSNGDENDKDIALAIRYAVDNGAKIINMSSSKEFSMHENWVKEALKYAEQHDVLFITSAANNGYNIDINKVYVNDVDENGKEILTNFINVGASTRHVNKNLIASFSNYGKENVDVFAPGKEIYTTKVNNQYTYKNGTSMATPIVSGIAAMLKSYFPKLKAYEIKEILLASGVSYNIDVEIREGRKKKLVPFSSLSKTGKIVNAYNALLLAKHYKKWKKGKWHFN